jgi:hypothetical protein
LTASFTGFVNGEILATSGVTGDPALNTTATNTSPAGNYPITVAIGSLDAANYSFSFGKGILTIAPPGNVSITSIARLADNHTRLIGAGDVGVIYTIQASADLLNWQDIGTATTGTGGGFEFEDLNPASPSSCFYRVALP